jgi:hypothetical protein
MNEMLSKLKKILGGSDPSILDRHYARVRKSSFRVLLHAPAVCSVGGGVPLS